MRVKTVRATRSISPLSTSFSVTQPRCLTQITLNGGWVGDVKSEVQSPLVAVYLKTGRSMQKMCNYKTNFIIASFKTSHTTLLVFGRHTRYRVL